MAKLTFWSTSLVPISILPALESRLTKPVASISKVVVFKSTDEAEVAPIAILPPSIVTAPDASISKVVALKSTVPAVPPPIVILPLKSKVVVSAPSEIPI